jgi:hypothetical protein
MSPVKNPEGFDIAALPAMTLPADFPVRIAQTRARCEKRKSQKGLNRQI